MTMTRTIATTQFLRLALLGDAAASGATGLLMAAATGPLSALLGLPEALLLGAGLILLPYAAFVGWLGLRQALPVALVWLVIVVNAIWALDSILLLLSGWVQPTALGTAFVIGQGLVVALFAELQFIGLRRGGQEAAATA
jgi:hypothetical protein